MGGTMAEEKEGNEKAGRLEGRRNAGTEGGAGWQVTLAASRFYLIASRRGNVIGGVSIHAVCLQQILDSIPES